MEKQMLRKFLLVSVVLTGLMLFLTSCGGSSKSTPTTTTGQGALFTLMTDAPSCDVLGFRVNVSSLSLTPQGSTSSSMVFPPSATVNPNFVSPQIEVTRLRDFSKILNLEDVNVGTYDKASVDLVLTYGATYDPTQSPPVAIFQPTSTTTTVEVNINPPLVITKGNVSAIQVDLDLEKSLQTDAQGQLTGTFTPIVTVVPLTASSTGGFGDMDDLNGFVQSVTPVITNSTSGFTGAFLLQTLPPNGPSLTVNITGTTQLFGLPGPQPGFDSAGSPLNLLLTPSFVELDGYIDSKGNLVANSVQVEDRENVTSNKVAYLGPVLTVTRDSSGNLTQFTMLIRNTQPDVSSSILPETPGIVTVSSSTAFQLASPLSNFANLTFDPANLAPGQEVAVSGTFTPNTSAQVTARQPVSLTADSVFLRLGTVQGNFTGLIQAGSDDKTGAFQFGTCSGVFQAAPTIAITDSQTNFVNVSGLSQLTPQPELLVKGLAFFEPQATTINSVPVPAGTLVILAKQVHEL
jgi:hypothetical protein